MLAGELRNETGHVLSDATLYFDRWVYRLGDLAPGGAVVLDERSAALDARTVLARRRIVSDQEVIERYDPESDDVARILEMRMFHELAGGKTYSGLENRYQSFIDCSPLVRAGRAVVVARVATVSSRLEARETGSPAPAEAMTDAGATIALRFVLPVTPRDEGGPR